MSPLVLRLDCSELQRVSLLQLQGLFADACNSLAPLVRERRCWSRVALHHMTYRELRERFPALGSQMVCNVIYAVCRAARLVYQHPASPWCVTRREGGLLPLLNFAKTAPVYFDRHTLSFRKGGVSLYTLDGRCLFVVQLSDDAGFRFAQEKVREITLNADADGFYLSFVFAAESERSQEVPVFPDCVTAVTSEQVLD